MCFLAANSPVQQHPQLFTVPDSNIHSCLQSRTATYTAVYSPGQQHKLLFTVPDSNINCCLQSRTATYKLFTVPDSNMHSCLQSRAATYTAAYSPSNIQSVSQGRICSAISMCCHTELETADPTCYVTRSMY